MMDKLEENGPAGIALGRGESETVLHYKFDIHSERESNGTVISRIQ